MILHSDIEYDVKGTFTHALKNVHSYVYIYDYVYVYDHDTNIEQHGSLMHSYMVRAFFAAVLHFTPELLHRFETGAIAVPGDQS